MISPKNLVVCGKGGFAEGERFARLPAREKQASQMVAGPIRVSMFGAERLFVGRQRTLVERPCLREAALRLKQAAEVLKVVRRSGILEASPTRRSHLATL